MVFPLPRSLRLGRTRVFDETATKPCGNDGTCDGAGKCSYTAALRADETRSRQILERIPAGRWGEPRRHRRRSGLSLLGRFSLGHGARVVGRRRLDGAIVFRPRVRGTSPVTS